MKTCPTCGASVAVLITKLATNEWICHNCIEDKTHPAAIVSRKIHEHTVAGTLDKYPESERLKDLQGDWVN